MYAAILISLLAIWQAANETGLPRDSFRFVDTPSYGSMSQRAINSNTPLIVYVRTMPHNIPGVLSLSADAFDLVNGPAIVVGVPHQGVLYRADLPATASPAQVLSEVSRLRSHVTQWFAQQPQRTIICTPRG